MKTEFVDTLMREIRMMASSTNCAVASCDGRGASGARQRHAAAPWLCLALSVVIVGVGAPHAGAAPTAGGSAANRSWRFVVTGDSRNCGNLVMPAIAAGARAAGAKFFWHLGDFRAIAAIDEDFSDDKANPKLQSEYEKAAWNNFIENQLTLFGKMPVFLAIGNHDLIRRTRADYLAKFENWLSAPEIGNQRRADDPFDANSKTYYHWIENGIDFITMDNASDDQFDAAQMFWFEKVLEKAERSSDIRHIVVGMHKPLPGSISEEHSMSESGKDLPIQSGRQAYRDLLRAQNEFHKKVYVLASHSHYYMDDIFNTDAWKDNVLPGWIVGTGGAQRHQLPPDWRRAHRALQGVYGYMVATVQAGAAGGGDSEGPIHFEFKLLNRSDVPASAARKFSRKVIDFCFDENMRKPN